MGVNLVLLIGLRYRNLNLEDGRNKYDLLLSDLNYIQPQTFTIHESYGCLRNDFTKKPTTSHNQMLSEKSLERLSLLNLVIVRK